MVQNPETQNPDRPKSRHSKSRQVQNPDKSKSRQIKIPTIKNIKFSNHHDQVTIKFRLINITKIFYL
jgi:hypothetical protein